MDVAANGGAKVLAKLKLIKHGEEAANTTLEFEVAPGDGMIEVRLICELGFKASIAGVIIAPVTSRDRSVQLDTDLLHPS